MTSPSRDPASTKYPDRIFHSGAWMTEEQIERRRKRELARSRNRSEYFACHAKRKIKIRAGGINFYIGYAPTIEAANYLRKKIREESPR